MRLKGLYIYISICILTNARSINEKGQLYVERASKNDETVGHQVGECSKLVQGEYKGRRDKVGSTLGHPLCLVVV